MIPVFQQASTQVTTQATPAPPAAPGTVSPGEISARIEEAVNRALSDAGVGRRENVGERVRQAIQQAQDEIAAATARGQSTTVQPPFDPSNMVPPEAVTISVAFFAMVAFIVVGLPLARAFARRMDRRGESAPASELAPRLDRIEQAIEAVAIEVERVSEGQRYTTKAISELRGLPASNPIGGWPAGAREAERAPAAEARRP